MIATILSWLGLAQPLRSNDAADRFMDGMSIAQIAAAYGAAQETMIPMQRQVEQGLRGYIADLEREIAELRAELTQ